MNFVESTIQPVIDSNQQKHLPISGIVIAQKTLSDAKEKIKPLKASLEDDEHKLRPLEEQKKEKAPNLQRRKQRRWVYIAAAIIAIAEGYFSFEAFRAASIPKIPALFLALGIGVAIGFGVHFLGGYIQKAKTGFQRIFRYCVALIPAFIGFYILGNLRAQGYNHISSLIPHSNEIAAQQTGGVSGASLTILSFLLYLVALLFAVRFHKTDEESKQDQEYDRLCKEIDKLKIKMRSTKNEIDIIQKEANDKANEALARYEYALAIEKRLVSIARHSMEVYKASNLRHRTDGLCPEFFSYPPAFNFKLFFDNGKNDNVQTT